MARGGRWHYIWLAGILLLGSGLRLWQIDSIPPGFDYDEAANGVDALYILAGERPIFLEGNNGREPLFIYLVALVYSLFGPTAMGMRAISAVAGTATILATYLLARRMFDGRVGLLAAFLLATSYWHIHISRLGLRAILLPLLEALALYCVWRGLQQRSIRWFGLAGVVVGLSAYSYLASRLVPIWLVIFLLGALVWRPWRLGMSARELLVGVCLLGLVAALVFAPLGWYFWEHQDQFFFRSASVVTPASLSSPGLHDISNTLGMFTFNGETHPRRNLPGRPVFDWLQGGAFYAGILLALYHWRRPAGVACILVTAVMLAPGALSSDSPHALRTAGAIPTVMILPAWFLIAIMDWLPGRLNWPKVVNPRPIAMAGIGIALLWGTISAGYDYFGRWAPHRSTYDTFQTNASTATHLAGELAVDGQISLGVVAFYRGMPVPLAVSGNIPPIARSFDTNSCLVAPASDGRPQYYVTFSEDAFFKDGPDKILSGADLMRQEAGPGGAPAATAYRVDPSTAVFRQPQHITKIRLGEGIEITGYDLPARVPPGARPNLRVYWRLVHPVSETGEWHYFAHLLGPDGRKWDSVYREGCPPSLLQPGDRLFSWFPISIPHDMPESTASVVFGRVNTRTGETLPVYDGEGRRVGSPVTLARVRVYDPSPRVFTPQRPAAAVLGGTIELTGYDLQKETTPATGLSINLTLYWRSIGPIDRDYTVFVQLLDKDGKVAAQHDRQPQNGGYPTSLWGLDEVILDQVRLSVPQVGGTQEYQLIAGMYDLATGQRLPVRSDGVSVPQNYVSLGR
jgi:4-amino-4-deoxy-L-arabinose transferase-like glycosyltransferase